MISKMMSLARLALQGSALRFSFPFLSLSLHLPPLLSLSICMRWLVRRLASAGWQPLVSVYRSNVILLEARMAGVCGECHHHPEVSSDLAHVARMRHCRELLGRSFQWQVSSVAADDRPTAAGTNNQRVTSICHWRSFQANQWVRKTYAGHLQHL